MAPITSEKRNLWLAVIISALGYFVDVYDIVLFTVIRVPSLKSLSLSEEQITTVGMSLMNMQLFGMVLGGILWGMLGDRRGRLSVLFGSIFLYSGGNLANAYVNSVELYGFLRFLVGVGLAGELGAGIALVSELMSKETRGLGTTVIATAGVLGGISAGLLGNLLSWRMAYIAGGMAGFLLLFLRMGLVESGLYTDIKKNTALLKGNPLMILRSKELLKKYITCLLIGIPIWISIGLLITLSPEIGRALEINVAINAGWAILFFNVGFGIGDLSSGIVSQILKSRKKVALIYLVFCFASAVALLSIKNSSGTMFYALCIALGIGAGYWAVFLSITAEQFGTNLRATVTTSLPNFVRAMVIPCSFIFNILKPELGTLVSLGLILSVSIFIAMAAISSLKETFAVSLDFVER